MNHSLWQKKNTFKKCSDRVKKWLWFYTCVSTQRIRQTYKPFRNSTHCKIFMNTADTMRVFCQYYRCFKQILMAERTHWLRLLRSLWQILWDNSSLSTLLFIQSCKRYLSNETCVYWCNDLLDQAQNHWTFWLDKNGK